VPRSWAVLDTAVVGMAYGHALREFALSSNVVDRAWGVAESVDAVPDDAERLALCGRSAGCGPAALSRFAALKDVRVLSPPDPSVWIAAKPDAVQVKVFCGDLSARCPADSPPGLVVVPGAADFLPSWPSLAFGR